MSNEYIPETTKQKSSFATSETSIFLTVGTDLPFDRLVVTLDEWAKSHPEVKVYAQIGKSEYQPQNMCYTEFLEPTDYETRFRNAEFIISHAGMGTILSSLKFEKPLIVMPRKASLGEHRNEHQIATARHLSVLNKVNVAQDETDLVSKLNSLEKLECKEPIGAFASIGLTDAISDFIHR